MANSFHYEVRGWVWTGKNADYEIVTLASCMEGGMMNR